MKKIINTLVILFFSMPHITFAAEHARSEEKCSTRFFISNNNGRYLLPPTNGGRGYWEESPSIPSLKIAQFDNHTIDLRISVQTKGCKRAAIHASKSDIHEFLDTYSIVFFDGASKTPLGKMPLSSLSFSRPVPSPSSHQPYATKWATRLDAILALNGTWYMSDLFVDHWLCAQIVKPLPTGPKPDADSTTCIMRWKPKTKEQKALQLTMQARFPDHPPRTTKGVAKEETLFHAKKRLFERSTELDPIHGGGWFGLFSLYKEHGMLKEANQALDSWKMHAPPEMHKMIESIRAGKIRL